MIERRQNKLLSSVSAEKQQRQNFECGLSAGFDNSSLDDYSEDIIDPGNEDS